MVLITGGAGFIGSHVALALLQAGERVVLLDDFSNSRPGVVQRVAQLAGSQVDCVQADVRDVPALNKAFVQYEPDAVMHLAALKSVAQSARDPGLYLSHNVDAVKAVRDVCIQQGVSRLVFTSSASVYGADCVSPIGEQAFCEPFNAYGHSKLEGEKLIADAVQQGALSAVVLRCFNAAGAHESGLLGDDPPGEPSNLFAVLSAAVGSAEPDKNPELRLNGRFHATRDGSCERDYVHVQDVALAHVAALRHVENVKTAQPLTLNVGSGQGRTVLEVCKAFEQACGRPVNVLSGPAREGDLASYFADVSQAASMLGWAPRHTLADMARDALRYRRNAPVALR